MYSGHKTVTGFLTVIAVLLLTIVGLLSDWPRWLWPLGGGILLAVVLGVLAHARAKRPLIPPERLPHPDLPIPTLERWERVVRNVSLPTRSPDYDFLFSATVRWVPQDDALESHLVNTGGIAVDAVLARAQQITADAEPQRSSLVQHRLNGELATMLPDPSGRVHAMAEGVHLTLADADRERLDKLADVRKNESVWEHERKWEQSKRAYLGDDVLKTPGSAVVWWLARNDERVDKTVADIGLLAELSSAANDGPVPQDFHRYVPGLDLPGPEQDWAPDSPDAYADMLVRHAGLAEDDPRRDLFIERMAQAAEAADLKEVADALRERIASPPPPPPDDEFTPDEPPDAYDS
ncbi:phage holin family protein [Streptomyces sp. NPDC006422]|uniref:phage holin family protein n=1 Tax=unclassified Streptomyces TaxID=2593676 RepID=UPI0033A3C9CF